MRFSRAQGFAGFFFIWHHLVPWQPNAPDFLVLHEGGCALLVKVSLAAVTGRGNYVPAPHLVGEMKFERGGDS